MSLFRDSRNVLMCGHIWGHICHNKIPWALWMSNYIAKYRQTSNIGRTFDGNKIVDHSDVVGASPVGAAPTTSSFLIWHLASMDWTKTTVRRDEKHLSVEI